MPTAIRGDLEALSVNDLKPLTIELELVRGNALRGIDAVTRGEELLRAYAKHYVPAGPRLVPLIDALREATDEVTVTRPGALRTSAIPKASTPIAACCSLNCSFSAASASCR